MGWIAGSSGGSRLRSGHSEDQVAETAARVAEQSADQAAKTAAEARNVSDFAQHLGWVQLAWEVLFALVLALLGIDSRHIGSLKKRQAELETRLVAEREQSESRMADLERRM